MTEGTYTKFVRVAKREARRRHLDPDDLLQDVLLNLVERGLDPEENQGLVISRIRWHAMSLQRTETQRPETLTWFGEGWRRVIDDREPRPAHERQVAPGAEALSSAEDDLASWATVEWVYRYVDDILASKLDGRELEVARDYYLEGMTYDEISGSPGPVLSKARKRLDEDDLADLGAWDAFNRSTFHGRRRLELSGAPRLLQALRKADMV